MYNSFIKQTCLTSTPHKWSPQSHVFLLHLSLNDWGLTNIAGNKLVLLYYNRESGEEGECRTISHHTYQKQQAWFKTVPLYFFFLNLTDKMINYLRILAFPMKILCNCLFNAHYLLMLFFFKWKCCFINLIIFY